MNKFESDQKGPPSKADPVALSSPNNLSSDILREPCVNNLISNSSGENGYDGWKIIKEGGDGWAIEKQPINCSTVSTDEFLGVKFRPNQSCCFVTSHDWCSKSCLIDLKNELSIVIGKRFQIKCGQMYTTRDDCGGEFVWKLSLLDEGMKVLKGYKIRFRLSEQIDKTAPWKQAEYAFKFQFKDKQLVERIKYLEFLHEGKDAKHRNGHYGMKFARATVVVAETSATEMKTDNDPENQIGKENRQCLNKNAKLGHKEKVKQEKVPLMDNEPNVMKLPKMAKVPTPKEDAKNVGQSKSSGVAKLPLKIQTLDGKTCRVLAYTNWTVKKLKQEFRNWSGGRGQQDSETSIILHYKAKILNDGDVLGELNVEPDAVIQANFGKSNDSGVQEPMSRKANGNSEKAKSEVKLVGNCVGTQNGTEPEIVEGVEQGSLVAAQTDQENLTIGEVGVICKIKGLGDTVYVGVKFRKQLALGSSGIQIEHAAGIEGYCDGCQGRKYLYIPLEQFGNSKHHLFQVQ